MDVKSIQEGHEGIATTTSYFRWFICITLYVIYVIFTILCGVGVCSYFVDVEIVIEKLNCEWWSWILRSSILEPVSLNYCLVLFS